MDAYVYNKFCKSHSCFTLDQASDPKRAYVGRRPEFHKPCVNDLCFILFHFVFRTTIMFLIIFIDLHALHFCYQHDVVSLRIHVLNIVGLVVLDLNDEHFIFHVNASYGNVSISLLQSCVNMVFKHYCRPSSFSSINLASFSYVFMIALDSLKALQCA
jgi:hypothetical protein